MHYAVKINKKLIQNTKTIFLFKFFKFLRKPYQDTTVVK